MVEHLVYFKGTVSVEAENEEKAQEKARELLPNSNQVMMHLEGDVENLMQGVDHGFQVKLERTGRPGSNFSTEMIKGDSALAVAFEAVNLMLEGMVGVDDYPMLKYDLALLLLASVRGDSVNPDNIWEGVEDIRENVDENGFEWVKNLWSVQEDEEE